MSFTAGPYYRHSGRISADGVLRAALYGLLIGIPLVWWYAWLSQFLLNGSAARVLRTAGEKLLPAPAKLASQLAQSAAKVTRNTGNS